MQYLIQLLISGLAIGAIYGLIAMGFAVIYKSTGLVNFAQGEMTMITAYIAWTISTTVSGNVFVVALGAILAAIVLGLVIERVVMRPMLGEPVFAIVMVTIGLAVILRSSIISSGMPIRTASTSASAAPSFGSARSASAPGRSPSSSRFCCCSPRSGRSSATASSASRCARWPPTTAPRS